GVELTGAIGTGPTAEFTADAFAFVDQHDAVRRPLVGGSGRTDRHTGRRLAMQARAREIHGASARLGRVLVTVHAVEPDAVDIAAIGIDVGQRRHVAARVPFLAGGDAGLTADTGVEIDDQAEPFVGLGGKAGHSAASLLK